MKASLILQIERLPGPTALGRISTPSPADASKFAVRHRCMLCHSIFTNSRQGNGFHRLIYPSSAGNPAHKHLSLIPPFPTTSLFTICLWLVGSMRWNEVKVDRDIDLGLALTPVDLFKNQYRRVGYFGGRAYTRRRKRKIYATPESVVEIIRKLTEACLTPFFLSLIFISPTP